MHILQHSTPERLAIFGVTMQPTCFISNPKHGLVGCLPSGTNTAEFGDFQVLQAALAHSTFSGKKALCCSQEVLRNNGQLISFPFLAGLGGGGRKGGGVGSPPDS